MTVSEYFKYLQEQIHTVIVATVDHTGLPVTCAVDIMDSDEKGLYFLTAKGKDFYDRLTKTGYAALTGIKGEDTLSCVAVSVRGKVKELGSGLLSHLFAKNPYMNEIYPTLESQKSLTVFQLYEGKGEWFDLSKKPIERVSFMIGDKQQETQGYWITKKCIKCKACKTVCPQNCIDFTADSAVIKQENCLHCGNCLEICPQNAVIRKG